MDREYLIITVLEIVPVSTSLAILKTVHVLRVDVNVEIKAVPVVQICDTCSITTLTLRNKNVDVKFFCTQRVSGVTIIRYVKLLTKSHEM